MDILFNTERFNIPHMDAYLFDMLFAIKDYVESKISQYDEEIKSQNGKVVIIFKPKENAVTTCGMDILLSNKIVALVQGINFMDIVKPILRGMQN